MKKQPQLSTDVNSKNVECSSAALCAASKTDAEQAECKAEQKSEWDMEQGVAEVLESLVH